MQTHTHTYIYIYVMKKTYPVLHAVNGLLVLLLSKTRSPTMGLVIAELDFPTFIAARSLAQMFHKRLYIYQVNNTIH